LFLGAYQGSLDLLLVVGVIKGLVRPGNPKIKTMVKMSMAHVPEAKQAAVRITTTTQTRTEAGSGSGKETRQEENKGWAMEVSRGKDAGREEAEMEDGMLELDMDEEDAVKSSHVLGIAVFYSKKSYNPQYLFSDMINA
jgi:hypothetical protein